MFASFDQGLLNIRTHVILLPVSHLSHNQNTDLFGVSGWSGERNKQYSAEKNCVGFSVKQILTQMLNLEMRRKVNL